jgi:hypothetical protein
MAKKKKERGVCRGDAGAVFGPVWVIGWLFTIGYLGMPFFWKGVLALLIWPYYLGMALR